MLINTLVMTTISALRPVVSLYASDLGMTPAEISFIIIAFPLLPVFLSLQIGKWIDKYGIHRMVTFGNVLFLSGLLLTVIVPNFMMLIIQQLILGVAFTCLVVSLQKRVGSVGENVERTIANYSLTGGVAAMIGPVLGTMTFEHFGFQVFCYVNIFLMVASYLSVYLIGKPDWDGEVPGSIQKKEQKLGENVKKESIWLLLRQRSLRNALIISGLVLSNRELFAAYFPLLAREMGISPTMIGLLLSLSGLASLLIRVAQHSLVERFSRTVVLTWSLYISGLVYILTPVSPWVVTLAILVGVLGAGLGIGQPLCLSYAIQVSPPDRRGEVLGFRITVNRGSQIAIPLLFGGIGGLAGVSVIFWASGAILMVVGYLTRPLPSDEEQVKVADTT